VVENDTKKDSLTAELINSLVFSIQAINTLPEKQRAVFNLRYYDEMPYEEMSRVLGTSEGALKASYHHAVKKIEDFILNH